MKKTFTRILATILCVVMMVGLMPIGAFAVNKYLKDENNGKNRQEDWNDSDVQSWYLLWPLDWKYRTVTSPQCDRDGTVHKGIDIYAPKNTPVKAAANGTIVFAGYLQWCGYTVTIWHPNIYGGVYTRYQHLNKIQKFSGGVSAGDVIAYTGNTGMGKNGTQNNDSDSNKNFHLHFGVDRTEEGGWARVYINCNETYISSGYKQRFFKTGIFKYTSDKALAGTKVKAYDGPSYFNATDVKKPEGKLPKGKSFGLYGIINSGYNLTWVQGEIINRATGQVVPGFHVEEYPSNTSYNINQNKINKDLIFNKLPDGSYRYEVKARDSKGYNNNNNPVITSDFTIGNGSPIPTPNPPTYDIRTMSGGYYVYINSSSGTEIRYTTNGSDPTKSSTKYNGGFAVKSTCTIKAIAIKDGIVSGINSRTITVNQVARPTIKSALTNNDYTVEINCNTSGAKIYYTLDGTTPSPYKYYYSGPIHLTYGATVNAYAIKDGMADSAKAIPVTVRIVAPSAPNMSIQTGSDIAVGDPIEVRWNKDENATSYKVRVYRDGNQIYTETITGTKYIYIPKNSGKYTFGIDSVNFVGMSSTDSTRSVTAHDPVTVKFVDYDGTVIKEQKVSYGRSAVAPQTPKRKGWVFREWDNGRYFNATSDVTVKALYDREKYIIRFVDENGITIAPQQEVEYEGSVILPPDPSNGLAGYSFMGWRTISADNTSLLDYNNVDANLTLQAVFDWGNKDLPVAVQSASATKSTGNNHTVYAVSAKLNNGASETTYCRIIITLKTSTGKAVQTAIRDFTIAARATNASFTSGEIICDKAATKVEINIVGLDENGNRTGGAYSDNYLINSIDDQARAYYTDWSATRSNASNVEETKTMYRYRDKQFTTSTSSSLSGWTQYNSTTSYGAWSGNQTTTSYPGSSDTLQIVGQSTTYNYYHYCSKYDGRWNVDSCWVNNTSKRHTYSTTNKLPSYTINADKGGKRTQCFGYQGCTNQHACSYNFYTWWLESEVTTYTYQTRSKTTTYYFWKWGNWSSWSETPVSSSGNREVQTTTYYRYKITPQSTTDGEDNTGTPITMSGNLVDKTALDLAGRKATIFVYKAQLNDPTANYIEYMGQTTIGAENTYNFTFVPAETPDEAESNFIVALAIEGQTSLFNIDVLEKTIKEQYQVDFYADGELINTQMVSEGSDAIIPEPPEIPGKVFVGWNNDTTNVIASRKIEAYYVDESYSVVFVDFETDFVSMEQYKYGEVIAVPEHGQVEGKTFLGWEGLDEDDPIAREHSIFIAKYETGTFTVKFEDGYNNVISTQTVAYGEAAELPEAPEKEGLVFMGWSQSIQWWNVKQDMVVMPIWVYENTVAHPNVQVENLYFGGAITAETDTEGATIYCAIDDGGGEPPMTLSEQEAESHDIGLNDNEDELSAMASDSYAHQPLHTSLLSLFSTTVFAEDADYTEFATESDHEFSDVNWVEYSDSLVLNYDATIYFYATADNMNDSEIVTLNYKYEPVMNPYEDHTGETFTVTFIDEDGFVLDEQTVNYFEDAVAPEVEEKEGFIFTGWDNQFDHVTEDLEVTAQYVPEDEYVEFSLNSSEVTLTSGDTYSLRVNVVNAPEDMGDIVWESSNETVATVSIDGFVITNQPGETVITAKAYNNNRYSESCKVTVLPNANDTVTLRNNSNLSLENGLLTQIPIESNHKAATVGEIKDQLASANAKIVSADGNEMPDSAIVTTNSQIRIIVDDIVIDAVIVIVTGDYDCNGIVNNRDAARIMRYLVNKETPNESQLYASDVNKDGDVNNRDAAIVSRYLVGKETI